jgi:hypothetical protein
MTYCHFVFLFALACLALPIAAFDVPLPLVGTSADGTSADGTPTAQVDPCIGFLGQCPVLLPANITTSPTVAANIAFTAPLPVDGHPAVQLPWRIDSWGQCLGLLPANITTLLFSRSVAAAAGVASRPGATAVPLGTTVPMTLLKIDVSIAAPFVPQGTTISPLIVPSASAWRFFSAPRAQSYPPITQNILPVHLRAIPASRQSSFPSILIFFGSLGLLYTSVRRRSQFASWTPVAWVCLLFVNTTMANAVQVVSGSTRTCTIVHGMVGCWGKGAYGALGRGNSVNWGGQAGEMTSLVSIAFPSPTLFASQVFSAGMHTCVIFSNKKVKNYYKYYFHYL